MFYRTLRNTLRQFTSHKLYSSINVLGLGLGLGCCLMITLFVVHEMTYDRRYANADRLALAYWTSPGQEGSFQGNSSMLMAPLLEQDFEQIVATARLSQRQGVVTRGEQSYRESLQYADPAFFRLFDVDWLAGDPATALENPNAIVLTQATAEKYFGSEDPMGQSLLLDNYYPVNVSGVIKDLPSNTHLNLTAIAHLDLHDTFYERLGMDTQSWGFNFVSSYVLLDDPDAVPAVRAGLADFSARYTVNGDNPPRRFDITPVKELYLGKNFRSGGLSLGNLARVQIFSAIAASILFIAVINFMNLSTARASWRAREVGMSFVVGAGRLQLICKFLAEAVIMVLFAMGLGLLITELFLPVLNGWLDIDLSLGLLFNPAGIGSLVSATLVIGLLAGSYPAFYLSAFRPVKILKGDVTRGQAGAAMRNLLVMFQFAISICLIIVSVSVFQQMRYIRAYDNGFNQDMMITLQFPDPDIFNVNSRWDGFRTRLLGHPDILEATHAQGTPLMEGRLGVDMRPEEGTEVREMNLFMMADNFLQAYDIDLLAGRYYSGESDYPVIQDIQADTPAAALGSVILNAQAVRELGWTPEQALGKTVRVSLFGGGLVSTVIGVAENTVPSARLAPESMIYVALDNYDYSFFRGSASVKVAPGDLPGTLRYIDDTWDEYMQGEPIDRRFLEDQIEARYQLEQLQMKLFTAAAIVAVLVACFGLFGLATFNTQRRTKEIGIRKVLGGSVWEIVLLLTGSFSRLVLLSNLIAWPVAWVAMNRWLENFVYRIDLTPLIFISSALIALCVAWATVGGTAARAASRKPVLALRYE